MHHGAFPLFPLCSARRLQPLLIRSGTWTSPTHPIWRGKRKSIGRRTSNIMSLLRAIVPILKHEFLRGGKPRWMKTCTCGQKQRKKEGEGCEKQSPHTFPQKKRRARHMTPAFRMSFSSWGDFFFFCLLRLESLPPQTTLSAIFFSSQHIAPVPYQQQHSHISICCTVKKSGLKIL